MDESPPGTDTPQPTPDAAGPPPGRSYLPFVAYPVAPVSPPPPTWTKTYELPTARRVVSSGLQLTVESSRAIRRASIYIGLLALGAFGPTVLLLLLWIGRLMSDPATAATMSTDPIAILYEQPELAEKLNAFTGPFIVGFLLLMAISIDASAMAIALLGGQASDQPLRLREAIARARQVFWRLAGAGLIVGFATIVIELVLTIPFIRPFESNTGVTFIASLVAGLVVTPFVFASAGIVLGDVGAIEALRRSMTLFRARPRIALVVTLFTLVTSAIQTFAISAGADAVVRVGEALHLGFDQGALALVVTAVIILAFIVAFGSLTFTIAAIVAAPQVTGFLGLTYYSSGLDRARSSGAAGAPKVRWVSRPMVVAMIGLLLLAVLGLPDLSAFTPRLFGG